MLAQDVVGVVIDEIDFRAGLKPLPRRADDEGGFAAFSDRKDHVAGPYTQIRNLLPAELGEVLEPFHGLDEGKVAAGHHAQRAMLELLRRGRAFQAARALLLPEIAPDGHKLDAQAPGGAAAGKEDLPAVLQRAKDGVLDICRPTRAGKLTILADNVTIRLEQQAQCGAHVSPGDLTQVGGDGVGSLSGQDAKLELTADLKELIGTPVGGFTHGSVSR